MPGVTAADEGGQNVSNDRVDSVLVVSGGPAPHREVLDAVDLSSFDLTIAADRGLDHARALGLSVDVVVGDLDSVDAAAMAFARSEEVRVVEYPNDKEASDLELALSVAVSFEPESVLVIGSGGGRFDHVVGNLMVLGDRSLHHVAVSARFDSARIVIVAPGGQRTIRGRSGETFSVFAIGGEAGGVEIVGARWPLVDASLSPTGTVGLSNEVVDDNTPVTVAVGAGVLAVIQAQDSQ